MNTNFKIKLLGHLSIRKRSSGFTLIELLVVIIIIGVLAAIALPNLIGQIGKGRTTEARSNLGALNRSEQAYQAESNVFAPSTFLSIKLVWQYYSFQDLPANTFPASYTSFSAIALPALQPSTNNYASAVALDTGGSFTQITCENLVAGTNTIAAIATPTNAATLACPNTTRQIN